VADLKTVITEVVTGLGMCGDDDVGVALKDRPGALENVSAEEFRRLGDAWNDGRHRDLFVASFMNGQAFLRARDALRGRPPLLVEWKGPHRSVGDEAVPADLRVDHVYLVSCKYLSRIVVNASPEHLFDRVLKGGHGQRTGSNWFHQVAPAEHAALYASVRDSVDPALPADVNTLTAAQRRAIAHSFERGGAWPGDGDALYRALVDRAAAESARRWKAAIGAKAEQMLWRLLRIGSAPYFVLGASPKGFTRYRIATPWDWRRHFELRAFDIEAQVAGQPTVAWEASVRRRADGGERVVAGHVEVRWSHGRFGGPPEAKVYLDTPHTDVPGYFALDTTGT
jgi:hypothetical protein